MSDSNRLAQETSPYLLQHAQNPVDWYPWCDEAFALAREQGKPVLVSVGYSACHWCHVMAHESFENESIAALMNARYVNVKVDREERPDIDKLYQVAHQLLAQRAGGWPLTVFVDPDDKLPFFAGTYFPPAARHGMPGFPDVLQRVADFYRDQRSEIGEQKGQLKEVFERIDATEATTRELDDTPLRGIRRELADSYDPHHGGFGHAPKFPHPASIERLLDHWAASRAGEPDERALHMAIFTLETMLRGGVYDQLGGAFFRYSVDARWEIPHFEKMLYDNGPLLGACANAYAATGREAFARAARETAGWVLREMQDASGGFYATLDADSEGEEGRFYVWNPDQVRRIVGDDDYALIAAHFGLDRPANFEGQHHLRQVRSSAEIAAANDMEAQAARARIDAARERLLASRAQRVRPGRDEKILTGWNALMIRGLAVAARQLSEPEYAAAATRATDFLHSELWRNGRLSATHKDGSARFNGYLDDYAHLADALVELLQCRWRTADLSFAVQLADALLEHFEDTDNGGFFFTADDHEALFHRPRPFTDDATPAGNGTALRALVRLGYLLGETRYLDAAERALRAAFGGMRRAPSAHATMIDALAGFLEPPHIVVLRGEPERLAEASVRLQAGFQPQRLVFAIPDAIDDLPESLAVRAPRGELTAYVCRGHQCTLAENLDAALAAL